jgi:hypothetical protein
LDDGIIPVPNMQIAQPTKWDVEGQGYGRDIHASLPSRRLSSADSLKEVSYRNESLPIITPTAITFCSTRISSGSESSDFRKPTTVESKSVNESGRAYA